ncbi:MAG: hypothetical protein LBE85_12720, partial [Candidatus Accumulibacter sp.]|nr:hypothetical protein [Accumulibacter sp.]
MIAAGLISLRPTVHPFSQKTVNSYSGFFVALKRQALQHRVSPFPFSGERDAFPKSRPRLRRAAPRRLVPVS